MRSFFVLVLLALWGCGGAVPDDAATSPAESDSAFLALQERGASPQAMGVDQFTSAHRFESLPDGGRIELQREVEDSAGVTRIRSHLRHVAIAFSQGDFQIPAFVHDREEVPGSAVMREKRGVIQYQFRELPRGGEVRIRSQDPAAIEAIHAFLDFQRSDHRTADHGSH